MYKILIAGLYGRMSAFLIKEMLKLEEESECSFLGVLTRDIDRKYEGILPREKIFGYSNEIIKQADAIVDFTVPKNTLDLLEYCKQERVVLISGTTGFSEEEKRNITNKYSTVKSIICPNFSIMSFLQKLFSIQLVKSIKGLQICIEDTHHENKKDRPSGTSNMLKGAINNVEGVGVVKQVSLGVLKLTSKHRIIFENDLEKIEIMHSTKSHEVYAVYAIKCALWLCRQKENRSFDISEIYGTRI